MVLPVRCAVTTVIRVLWHWDSRRTIPFENSLNEEQIDVFHKILDCVSETAADEMRSAYKVGFKDGATMMQGIQG